MAKTFLKIFAVILLVLCTADLRHGRVHPPVASRPGRRTCRRLDAEVGEQVTRQGRDDLAAGYDDSAWVAVRRMPGTVLEILQDAGVYPNLYYGMNLLTKVPVTCTNRTGGIERRSPPRPGSRPISLTSRASTTAPTSGSTATGSPTAARSSACTSTTSWMLTRGSTRAVRTPWRSR